MNTIAQLKSEAPPNDPVLRRFMLGFDGDSVSTQLAEYLAGGLAGVVIYQRNFRSREHLRSLTAEIRWAAGRPVLIGIDQEGGTRFALNEPFTAWPSAAELGRACNLKFAEEVAQAMATELRAAGCNLDFAPMLDLHVSQGSPVTTDRSFASDPMRVAELGTAFHKGLKAGGVLSCAKHFPGHGDTIIDPHENLPISNASIDRLKSTELIPFAAASKAGVPVMMTAHILLPEIDPVNPASLSHTILEGLLRRYIGFEGVILADDLGMGAVARRYSPGEAITQSLRACTDIAMLCHDWSSVAPAIAAVRKARTKGTFAETEWNASLDRIERVIAQSEAFGLRPPLEVIGCGRHRAIAEKIREYL